MGKRVRLITFLLLVLATCGCAHKTLIALAPDPDGKVGSASVTTNAGSVVLNKPYQATTVRGADQRPSAPEEFGKEQVEKRFAETLSIQPKSPLHFLLYFDEETTLSAASLRMFPAIMAAIAERGTVDILVVGHTDSLGSREYNMALSKRRASAVKELLVKQGVSPGAIQTTSHGKENPLIPTADNVSEPRNRRVEVVIK